MRRTLGLLSRDPGAAKVRAEREGGPARERFLLFEVAGQAAAIPLAFLREVVMPEGLAADPGQPGQDFASFLHRGSPIPAIHLRRLFAYPGPTSQAARRVVVGEAGGHRFGLLVDGVGEVVEVPPQAVLPLPDGATQIPAGCFRGIWARGERAVLLLDESGLAALGGMERSGEAPEAPAPLRDGGLA